MNTKKKISNSFWIDSLTQKKYELESKIPVGAKSRCEYWDSELEYSCYYQLLKRSKGCSIVRQPIKMILPPRHPFNVFTWKPDFELVSQTENRIIECKGSWILHNGEALSSFIKTLRLLSIFNPVDFENLLIVSDKAFQLGRTKIKVHSFYDLERFLNNEK